jgi:hypothetical protein
MTIPTAAALLSSSATASIRMVLLLYVGVVAFATAMLLRHVRVSLLMFGSELSALLYVQYCASAIRALLAQLQYAPC